MYWGEPATASPARSAPVADLDGETEVGDQGLELAVGGAVDEDVRGLDVAMEQALAVGRVEALGGLGEEPHLAL